LYAVHYKYSSFNPTLDSLSIADHALLLAS
jgi:hypothetical protein